jgi:RNA ligase
MSNNYQHPACSYVSQHSFDELVSELDKRIAEKLIHRTDCDNLSIYNYSKDCQFGHSWDEFTIMARGLILDLENRCIVALSFPKFFNASEKEAAGVVKFDSPFDAYTKMDGSLGIVYYYNSAWHVATRGSFTSSQSVVAEKLLHERIDVSWLNKDVTYLCEIIYPENRIVINYPFKGLVMLGAYNVISGVELDYDHDLRPLCSRLGMRIAERHQFESFVEAQEFVKTLPGSEEGFVVRFRDSGERVKLKGDEYCSLHKMISNITPLAIWELLCAGYSLDDYKKAMPEEFYSEIDEIVGCFVSRLNTIMHEVEDLHEANLVLSDKDLGLSIQHGTLRFAEHRSLLFPRRKKGLENVRKLVLDSLRPTGNVIVGYSPSELLQRSQSEE